MVPGHLTPGVPAISDTSTWYLGWCRYVASECLVKGVIYLGACEQMTSSCILPASSSMHALARLCTRKDSLNRVPQHVIFILAFTQTF